MTTKKISRTCEECGYVQEIRTDNRRKQKTHWRCTSCWHHSKLKLTMVPIVALFILAIGVSAAYAEQDVVVTLPIDRPFETDGLKCQTQSNGLLCMHPWFWSISPEGMKQIPKTPSNPNEYKIWIDEVIPLVEANPLIEQKEEKVPTKGETSSEDKPTPEELELAANEQILDDFEKCFGGEEQAGAFQDKYSIKKYEALVKRFLTGDDKLAQECISIMKVRNYSNAAYPGMVIDDLADAKTIERELKMSAGTQVTPEKLKEIEEAVVYPPWYKNPYTEWDGKNRGFTNTDEGINQFTGKTTSQILAEYEREKAASILTAQDIKNFQKENFTVICETAWDTAGLGGLSTWKWRTFLLDGFCDDLLSEEYMQRTTLGKFSTLEEARDHKLTQEQLEKKPDLRSHK